jgi:hypothetical protein
VDSGADLAKAIEFRDLFDRNDVRHEEDVLGRILGGLGHVVLRLS